MFLFSRIEHENIFIMYVTPVKKYMDGGSENSFIRLLALLWVARSAFIDVENVSSIHWIRSELSLESFDARLQSEYFQYL